MDYKEKKQNQIYFIWDKILFFRSLIVEAERSAIPMRSQGMGKYIPCNQEFI